MSLTQVGSRSTGVWETLDADVLSRTARAFTNQKGQPDFGRLPQGVAALLVSE